MKKVCENCKYFVRAIGLQVGEFMGDCKSGEPRNFGRCFRYPPIKSREFSTFPPYVSPQVGEKGFCGEWKLKSAKAKNLNL